MLKCKVDQKQDSKSNQDGSHRHKSKEGEGGGQDTDLGEAMGCWQETGCLSDKKVTAVTWRRDIFHVPCVRRVTAH